MNQIKETIPDLLKSRNLIINQRKTEEYSVSRGGPDEWTKCKYLGSLLDTQKDIARRKLNASIQLAKLSNIWTDSRMHDNTKMKIFNSLIAPIFLYNSEILSMTATTAEAIDSYHRRLLRKVLNVIYPDIITSERVYQRTKEEPWSETIKQRRLRWLGHLLRLDETTPARRALELFQQPSKKPRGGQRTTWLSTISKNLTEKELDLDKAYQIAQNRFELRSVVKRE